MYINTFAMMVPWGNDAHLSMHPAFRQLHLLQVVQGNEIEKWN